MPSPKNLQLVADYTTKIGRSQAIYLTDYRGLTVNELVELRAQVRQTGGELVVTKNSLLKISLANTGYKLGESASYTGPTATLFAYQDELAPLKVLIEYAKNKNLPQLKLGYIEAKLFNPAELTALASLPGKDQLRAILVATLAAPLTGLVRSLNYHQTGLVQVLKSIQEKRSN